MSKDRTTRPIPRQTPREPSLDYANMLETEAQTGNETYNAFVRNIALELRGKYNSNPYSRRTFRALRDKIDDFMLRHTGKSYGEFSRSSHPEQFQTNDYSAITNPALKRKLFEYRARIYISALVNSEQQGHDLDAIIENVKPAIIPFIKKEPEEPTFLRLIEALKRSTL